MKSLIVEHSCWKTFDDAFCYSKPSMAVAAKVEQGCTLLLDTSRSRLPDPK